MTVGGRHYPSIKAFAEHVGISYRKVRNWHATGQTDKPILAAMKAAPRKGGLQEAQP